ncbi:Protein REVEILLE 7 [Cardamine amara subsp. amara]|uniref:Protein REVEILLE 7 n=1 Tax=Cardamine amara subsp. amara TaxID=228776 RepID=A0ABD1B5T1_CARAN
MAAPDRSEELSSNIENGSCNSNEGTIPETSSNWIENVVKVRKPYTVTKQREKWTEEEHERFLEAIKLYGRGWRLIEEHIGSKTAVQIRSHAQKLFSKMAQEADNRSKAIVIPPPRPKRKPAHPYPRKSTVQYSQSPSSNLSAMEKGTKSPTSVLSPFASEDQNNGCSSPNSCTSDIQSIDKKNDYATSKQSLKEDDDDLKSMTSQENHGHCSGIKSSRHVDTGLSLGVWETSCTSSNAFGSVTEARELGEECRADKFSMETAKLARKPRILLS